MLCSVYVVSGACFPPRHPCHGHFWQHTQKQGNLAPIAMGKADSGSAWGPVAPCLEEHTLVNAMFPQTSLAAALEAGQALAVQGEGLRLSRDFQQGSAGYQLFSLLYQRFPCF